MIGEKAVKTGPLLKFCLPLLCLTLPALAAATKHKAVPAPTHKAAASKTASPKATSSKKTKGKTIAATAARSSKGKKTRIPRTLRTVPVSPVVRENAIDRVEANITATATSPFLYPKGLQHFFQALDGERTERLAGDTQPPASTVRILQFGDSHTAADIFTGEMRSRIQSQFGDGGLGFQFPGHPFAGYHLAGSLRSQSAGWLTEGNKFTQLGDGDLGLGGISIATAQPGQTITLETTCTALQLHYLQQPGGGRLQFSDNGSVLSTIETAPPEGGATSSGTPGTFSYSCSAGMHDFSFTTLDHAPVKLLGIVSEQPGVTYECLGINGAVAPLMLRWNQSLFSEYLRQRSPNLIVLAYGTNEAGSSAANLETYPADFGRLLDNLHRNAPEASILVMGPEDRSMSSSMRVSRRVVRSSWHPFAGTDRIINMQKEACRTHGCTFWDTRRRMGGFGSMQQWVAAGWGQPDRTHLTGTGYRALADALYADLVHAYNLYQQSPQRHEPDIAVQENKYGKASRNP